MAHYAAETVGKMQKRLKKREMKRKIDKLNLLNDESVNQMLLFGQGNARGGCDPQFHLLTQW